MKNLIIKFKGQEWNNIKYKVDRHLFNFDDFNKTFKCFLPAEVIVSFL